MSPRLLQTVLVRLACMLTTSCTCMMRLRRDAAVLVQMLELQQRARSLSAQGLMDQADPTCDRSEHFSEFVLPGSVPCKRHSVWPANKAAPSAPGCAAGSSCRRLWSRSLGRRY